MYDVTPNENPKVLCKWLELLVSAYKSLNRLDKPSAMLHLPHFFRTTMELLISNNELIQTTSSNAMITLLEQCVKINIELFVDDLASANNKSSSLLHKIFASIESGLSYKFHASWPHVMKVLACAFAAFGDRRAFPVVAKCLGSLANLRCSEQFTFKKEADTSIGRAIQTFGPKLVLDCIPLDITGNEYELIIIHKINRTKTNK